MDTGGSEGVRQVRLTVREAVAQVHNSGAFEEMKVKLINEMRVDRNEEDIQRKAKRIARQTNLVQRIYEDQRTLHSNPATIFQALHRELTRQLMNDIELGQFIDTAIDRFLFPTPGYRFHNNRSMDQSIKKSVESSLAQLAPGAKQNPKEAKNEIAPAKDEISKRTIHPVKSESKDNLSSLLEKRFEETKQDTGSKDALISPPGLDKTENKSLLSKEIGISDQQTGTHPTRTDIEQIAMETKSKGESEQARAEMVQSEVKAVEEKNEESSTQAPSTEKEKSEPAETKISHEDLQSLFDELNGSSGDELPTSKPGPSAPATESNEDESSSESDDELLLSPESEEEPSEPEKQKKNSRSSRLATVGSKRSTIPRKAKQKAKETATTSRRKRRRVH